jgi:hypothetical protein
MPPITLDDTDVQTALKLSDELNLNEIECVRLLVDLTESGFCMVENHWKYIDLQLASGTWREGIL